MKKLVFFTTILIVFSVKSYTQQFDTTGNYFKFYDAGMEYFQQTADSNSIPYYQVEGWKSFIRNVLFMKGKYDSYGNMTEYAKAMDEYFTSITDYEPVVPPVWEYIGHDELYTNFISGNYLSWYGQGNISCIWVNQDSLNHIIAGGNRGSLWKTTDGGDNWYCISNSEPLLDGTRSIQVNGSNSDTIYIAQGTSKYTNGMFSTTNGGTSWNRNKVYVTSESSYYYPTATVSHMPRKWIINPNNASIMFLLTKGEVLRSLDGGINWEILLSRDFDFWTHGQSFNDIEFDPVDPSIIYVSGPEVYRLTQNGNNIQEISSGVLQWSNNPKGWYKTLIGIQPAFPGKIWFAVNSWEGNDALLFYDKTLDRYVLLKQEPDLLDELKMQCEISPLNSNHISIGGLATYLYDHTTQKKYKISKSDPPTNWTHPDVRDTKYMHDGNGNEVLFYGNDGGVFRADPVDIDDWNWTYLANDGTNGIRNGHLHGFDCSNSSTDILYAGFQDMNSAIKINDQWYGILGGDGGPGTIDKTDPNYMYFSSFNSPASIRKSTNMWDDYELLKATESYSYPPIVLSPSDPNKLLVGDRCKIYIFNEVRQNNVYDSLIIIDDDEGAGRLDFEEIAVSESNGNVIFASTGRYWPGWASLQPDPLEKSLYKTTDGGDTWIDISDNITDALHYEPITGIAISPWDENELWLCFGTVASNTNPILAKKVYHSTDGGNSWTPMASGLPEKIPANEIVFDKRGGKLYLATDVGVYYYDEPEETWYNIINNAPSTHIGQIRFNYPKNKLRIGTHGHGIWQTDIPGDSITTVYINDDTTWAKPQHPNANIVINSNATLTITSFVYMAVSTKIIVMPGGKLIINGGTISYSHGGFWGGIEVWGNPENIQVPAAQGWLSISNGGTVENAVTGVRVGSEDFAGKGGGIVHTDSAFFRNNQTGVLYHDYAGSNIGNFNLTTFETTAELLDGSTPYDLMKLVNVEGITINGCTFRNTRGSTVAYNNRGKGITGIDATFYVDHICTSGTTPCTQYQETEFSNLDYGIYAIATTTTPFADIRETVFTSNKRGVYLSGMTLPRVTSNSFNLTPIQSMVTYGLYLDYCTDYWVEGNYFEGQCTPGFTPCDEIGVIVNESGGDPNEIYLNEFEDLGYAINVQGENRSSTNPAQGLQIRCNEYINTKKDETIMWDEPRLNRGAGIAGEQGVSNSLAIEDMASNIFFYEEQTTDYDDLSNEANHFDYYYSTNAGDFKVEPMDATWNTVEKHGQYTTPWTLEAACESGINTGGGGIAEVRSTMNDAQTEIETAEAILTALIDGGDTETLNAEVENSTPPEAVEVYNKLMSESPNLSETVIESTIEQETVIPNAMLRDIMVANPHSAKSLTLLDKLDERYDPLPDYMKAQILAAGSIQNLKQELESQLAGHKLRKARAMNTIIRYYNEEINNPQAASDSLLALYLGDNTPKSMYRLAWLYLERGEYQVGENVMSIIPNQFVLNDEALQRHTDISNVYALLTDLNEKGNTIDSLNTSQLSELQILAAEATIPAKSYARNILLMLGEVEYDEPILFPDLFKSAIATEDYNELLEAEAPKQLYVYPNPSTDYVILEYYLESEIKGSINIQDVNGKTIHTLNTSGKRDQVTLITKGWEAGLYIASLSIDGKTIESIKFTLMK